MSKTSEKPSEQKENPKEEEFKGRRNKKSETTIMNLIEDGPQDVCFSY